MSDKLLDKMIDYEIRGSLTKWLPLHLAPAWAARYYTWKTKKKVARWNKSRGDI